MTEATNNELFSALERMEAKLTTALNTGLQAVNLAITSLANAHHQALLDQERRNSSFADRDRVEQVATHVHNNGNEIMAIVHRVSNTEKRIDSLTEDVSQLTPIKSIPERVHELEDMVEARHTLFTANTIGYHVTIAAVLLSAIVAYLLAHHT